MSKEPTPNDKKALSDEELSAVTGGRAVMAMLGHRSFRCDCRELLIVDDVTSVTCPQCGRVWISNAEGSAFDWV